MSEPTHLSVGAIRRDSSILRTFSVQPPHECDCFVARADCFIELGIAHFFQMSLELGTGFVSKADEILTIDEWRRINYLSRRLRQEPRHVLHVFQTFAGRRTQGALDVEQVADGRMAHSRFRNHNIRWRIAPRSSRCATSHTMSSISAFDSLSRRPISLAFGRSS